MMTSIKSYATVYQRSLCLFYTHAQMEDINMIYILVGKSSSGKDYIMKKMVAEYGIQPIISYTSRPMRDGETNGVEYHFVSREYFKHLIEYDLLIEYRSYATLVDNIPDIWYYGLKKDLFDDNKRYVVILDIQGAKDFIEYYGKDKCKVAYVHCDDDVRLQRAEIRGGFNLSEWRRRLDDDTNVFSQDKLADVVDVYVDNTDTDVNDIIGEIIV